MSFWHRVTGVQAVLDAILATEKKIMASIANITQAQAQEHADLATLATQVTALLAAFASGAITPAQAQALLDEVNAQDATIKTNIASIQAALPPAA